MLIPSTNIINPDSFARIPLIQRRLQSPDELLYGLDRSFYDAIGPLRVLWGQIVRAPVLAIQTSSTRNLIAGSWQSSHPCPCRPHSLINSKTIRAAYIPVDPFDGTTTAFFLRLYLSTAISSPGKAIVQVVLRDSLDVIFKPSSMVTLSSSPSDAVVTPTSMREMAHQVLSHLLLRRELGVVHFDDFPVAVLLLPLLLLSLSLSLSLSLK